MFEVSIQTTFAAAHKLRDYRGKCEALHGHNWKVEVTVQTSELNAIGLGIDFKELKQKTNSVLQQLDHSYLNDLSPFQEMNPSSENIARFLFNRLKEVLHTPPIHLKKVSVWESENSWVTYCEDI